MLINLVLAGLLGQTGKIVSANAKVNLPGNADIHIRCVVDDGERIAWNALGKQIRYDSTFFWPGATHKDKKPNPENRLRIVVGMLFKGRGNDSPPIAFKFPLQQRIIRASNTTIDMTAKPGGPRDVWYSDTSVAFPPGTKAEDVGVGYALGKWKEVGSVKFKKGTMISRSGIPFLRSVSNYLAQGKYNQVLMDVNLPNQLQDKAYRFVAFDTKGKTLFGGGHLIPPDGSKAKQFGFEGKVGQLGSIQLQAQPYIWTTFKQVPLIPKR